MWYNFFVKLLLRSPLHGLASQGVMLISYTGRKTGQLYTIPVSYAMDEKEALLTTSFKTRTWWRNLRGGAPAMGVPVTGVTGPGVPVTLRLRGKEVDALAEVIEAETAVADYIRIYLRRFPDIARHFYISLDADGAPNPDDLAAAAAKRVIVRCVVVGRD